MRLLLCAVFLILPFQPLATASAASFDCDEATTDMEIAICADPTLSARDETLAIAYATAIGGLSDTALTAMRGDQRNWLRYAGEACLADADGVGDARTECLASLYDKRIATLEQSRMIGGHRFYLTTRYAVFPDPEYADDPGSLFAQANHEFAAPRLDGDSALAAGFNETLIAYVRAAGLGTIDIDAEDIASSDTENSLTVDEVRPRRITLIENTYWFGHGAAHGNYGIGYVHYLPDANRLLEASDLFSGKGWQARLAELTAAALRTEHGDMLFDDFEDYLAEGVIDPAKWSFEDYGLVLQFQPYEVSAYAYGAPTATVRWEDLEPLLADTADTIRWGY